MTAHEPSWSRAVASAPACNARRIFDQVPSADQRRWRSYTVCQDPWRSGRSRQGMPVRVR